MNIVEYNREALISELCNHHIYNVMGEMEDRIDESIQERFGGDEVNMDVTIFQIVDYIDGMTRAIEDTIADAPEDSPIAEIASVLNSKLGNGKNPRSREFAKIMLQANCVRIIVTEPRDIIRDLFNSIESDFKVFLSESEYESFYHY